MKNYFVTFWTHLRNVFINDLVNRYLFFFALATFLVDYFIWKRFLDTPDVYIFLKIGLYPIQFLAIIFALNTFLAFSSYNKEREISFLLLIGNVITAILILVLEIFYLIGN